MKWYELVSLGLGTVSNRIGHRQMTKEHAYDLNHQLRNVGSLHWVPESLVDIRLYDRAGGRNSNGFNPLGFDAGGFDTDGYDKNGLDVGGFDTAGQHAKH